MFVPRVIPALTLIEDGLYRTRRFRKPSYVGDPLNAVRIFNEKEVDEMIVLDITPEHDWNIHRLRLLEEMATQAFMPMALGGNISTVEHVEQAFKMGYDKVIINSAAINDIDLIRSLTSRFGAQSIVVSIDVGRKMLGKRTVFFDLGRKSTNVDAVNHARSCEEAGAGEIIIRSIEHDGLMQGFDLDLIARVSAAVNIPVVAAGGAGSKNDLALALAAGAHSVSAGSMFVYHGVNRAVLINYLTEPDIKWVIDKASELR
jgi:cyclase